MGVPKLLTSLDPYLEKVELLDFRGAKIGVDGHHMLHVACLPCARQICLGLSTKRVIRSFLNKIDRLICNDCTPVVVFDGLRIPFKAEQHKESSKDKEALIESAKKLEKRGEMALALGMFKKAFDKTPLVHLVCEELKRKGIEFYVSPYEGDAELAHLMNIHKIDVALTGDTDLVAYGCAKILFNMDIDGNASYYDRGCLNKYQSVKEKQKSSAKKKQLADFSCLDEDQLKLMCVFWGCDTFDGLKFTPAKVRELIVGKNFAESMEALKKDYKGPENAERLIHEAFVNHKLHIVYDPYKKRAIHLTEAEESVTRGLPLDFLGIMPYDHNAEAAANGSLDPNGLTKYTVPDCLAFPREVEDAEGVSERQLGTGWKLWFGDALEAKQNFNTLRGFVKAFRSIKLVEKLDQGHTLYCLAEKYDLSDAEGCWTQCFSSSEFGKWCLFNICSLVEDKLGSMDAVIGTSVHRVGNYTRMSLYTRNAGSDDIQLGIARCWKRYTEHDYLIGYTRMSESFKECEYPHRKHIFRT